MRHVVLVAVAAALLGSLTGSATAQNPRRQNPYWQQTPNYLRWEGLGVIAGPSITTLGGPDGEADRMMNWSAGAYAAYRFHAHARVQAELLYTREGGVLHSANYEGGDATLALAYLQPTILFEGVIAVNDRLEVQLYGGLTRAMLLSASLEDRTSVDIKDSIAGADIGIEFGASVEMMTGPRGRARADLRCDMGMSTLDDDDTYPADVRSRSVMLLVGYSFI